MARRAYIVLLRSDIEDSLLQVLDLIPNTSQRSFPYETAGQTHYPSKFLLDTVNLAVVTAAGAYVGDNYGLSTYMKANIEDQAAGAALTDVQAVGAAGDIEDTASAGNPLTAAVINALIQAQPGVNPATTLTAGNSTGSVEEVLRILAGERYKAPAGAIVEAAGVWQAGTGFFTAPPNLVQPTTTGPGGRKSTDRILPEVAPVQTNPEDVNHVFLREIYDTGDLHRSALLGVLAELKSANYTFVNPAFTYGPGGTAILLDGTTVVPATGTAAAVQVYKADGTVI